MRRPLTLALATLVLAALMAVGSGLLAQVQVPPSVTPAPNQIVLSGSDVGFRVDTWKGNVPVGRWVVRVDGRWVEPEAAWGGVQRLTTR
jgi:hypothetical protein